MKVKDKTKTKTKNKTKRKLMAGEIYMICSLIFFLACVGYYGGRFLYYHSLSSGKIQSPEKNLNKLLTATENLTMSGNGLEPYNDGYIYVGFPTNNFVEYSGILWRVIGIDAQGRISLITANDITTLPYTGTNDNTYSLSLIHRYLNPVDEDPNSGIFFSLLSNPEKYLEKGEYCTDTLAAYTEVLQCGTPEISEYVSLLNINQYILAGGAESYLDIGTFYWTLTGVSDTANSFYVFPKGGIGVSTNTSTDLASYGVRPVITLKANLEIVAGSGIENNPYKIEDEAIDFTQVTYLNAQPNTEYVSYGGHNWQIIGTDENGSTKLIMCDVIRDEEGNPVLSAYGSSTYKSNNTVGTYLNSTFMESLDHPEYLIEGNFNVGRYSQNTKYNYEDVIASTISAKIGIPEMYGLLTTNFIDPGTYEGEIAYWTSNYRSTDHSLVWAVRSLDWIIADFSSQKYAMRPVVYLKSSIVINGGNGTVNDPFLIVDESQEAGA